MGLRIRTVLLLGLLTGVIVLMGQLFGGRGGATFALGFAALMNFAAYWFSDKFVLRMYRAKPLTEPEAPELFRVVHGLVQRAGLPMPKLYLIETNSPNAFATGRNPEHAAVAVTRGLMGLLNSREIEGVLAHELAHVKNRDILISSIAATLAGAVMYMANMLRFAMFFGGFGGRDQEDSRGGILPMLAMAILAPIAALLIQMSVSRSREYLADATGARIVGSPDGLIDALKKLADGTRRLPMEASAATAHLFIVNPLKAASLASLFSTHPPMEERIKRLRQYRAYA